MDGSPVRGQGKAGLAQLNQIKDPEIFQGELVRLIAHDASPILARLEEIESLKRQNQELGHKAERAASAEANLAKAADEKNRFEALVKIGWYVQSNIAHDLRTPLGAIRGYAR